ncbi:hypothetical protein IFM89_023833 [Coptis chinensis]|uniref:Farnesyl pyrophosphate synthase n=1 Tax=Coptis chinensis TaxID=261450 RepID=A0A835MDD3_9MAGN|nr:hypothetical protein IFM89_023833 [Coptis chinensis]
MRRCEPSNVMWVEDSNIISLTLSISIRKMVQFSAAVNMAHILDLNEMHRRIVQYKTAYYSFYLPVACALLMAGENLDNHTLVKDVLIEMGTYFQVQDDYLDCFGDPEVIGKIGTDIEDFKCSWVFQENYGKADPTCVAKVKELYKDLNLQGVFAEYEAKSYEKLISLIEAHPSKAVQAVLKSFLGKIYKRQK